MARTSPTQKLGKRLKQLRLEAKLTQEKLSIATGLSQTYISGVESGKRNPSYESLVKILKAFGISESDILKFGTDYELNDNSRRTQH
jgi:transcriptional regulator with XRE-family HTH domain